jgi:hypothetical protein
MAYDPKNWYWVVGGSTTQVYSSAIGDYVPVADATYVAWLANGNVPTKISTEAGLGAVLAPYLLRPVAANVLDGYKDSLAVSTVAQVAFKIMFNHENRLRAIERNLGLNGSPPDLTAGQAKAAVKALM